jgi:hypothetical protein
VSLRIQLETWVSLPRLGKEAFSKLMKLGVEYSTARGFYFRADTNLREAKRIISSATGEEVSFDFKCYVCGRDASCVNCEYAKTCSIELVGGRCVCGGCAAGGLKAYREKWMLSLGSAD